VRGPASVDAIFAANSWRARTVGETAIYLMHWRWGTPYDATLHIVLDDFGRIGGAYGETDEGEADEQTIIDHVFRGDYSRSIRVVAFNTAEGVASDVAADIARAIAERARWKSANLAKVHGGS
jgi:hypothetical protein